MDKLIEAIKKLQELQGLSDQKFARSIGIDPGHWSKIKNGLTTPGMKFVNLAVRKYPELRLAAFEYIGSKRESLSAPEEKEKAGVK